MPQSKINYPFIVADIGGTNARFGLVNTGEQQNQGIVVENQKTFPSAEFDGVEQAVTHYLDSINGAGVKRDSIKGACLAVAGPVAGNTIKLTNLNWNICTSSARRDLRLENLQIINDFAAYAYAIQYVQPQYLRTVNKGIGIKSSPVAVVGPGTGFGVASLVNRNGHVSVLTSEGGHMSLAATTALQSAIKEQLSHQYSYVSIERVFSGPGLRRLYQALAAVEGVQARELSSAQVSQFGLEGSDDMCRRTLALFCSWLGSVIGDLTLALGARGGVYLGGGILPKIADFLIASDFRQSFKSKDQMSHYLQDIPVQLVTNGNSALLGAAAWFENCVEL